MVPWLLLGTRIKSSERLSDRQNSGSLLPLSAGQCPPHVVRVCWHFLDDEGIMFALCMYGMVQPTRSPTTVSKSSQISWSRYRRRFPRIPSTDLLEACPDIVESAFMHAGAKHIAETHTYFELPRKKVHKLDQPVIFSVISNPALNRWMILLFIDRYYVIQFSTNYIMYIRKDFLYLNNLFIKCDVWFRCLFFLSSVFSLIRDTNLLKLITQESLDSLPYKTPPFCLDYAC